MTSAANTPVRSGCPITNLLDLVGDRWSLLVMRDVLFFSRHEFKQFLRAGDGIASNILSARLKLLCEVGLLDSAPHPTNKVKRLYYATARGKDLLPVLLEIVQWSAKHAPGAVVPPQKLKAIKSDRAGFQRQVLASLKVWERENVASVPKR